MNALTTLKNAEQALVQQIDRATAAVDAIGTEAVEQALARLSSAVFAGEQRIAEAMLRMRDILDGAARTLAFEAGKIEDDLAHAGQQDDATARARGVLVGLIDAALAHEEAQLNADDAHEEPQQIAHEPRQDTTTAAPAPEASTVPIACQQATERGDDGEDDGKIDLDWCPTYADLPEEEEVATSAANPPVEVERDDRPTSPSTTRRRGRGGKKGGR